MVNVGAPGLSRAQTKRTLRHPRGLAGIWARRQMEALSSKWSKTNNAQTERSSRALA